ncbi:unnamed protein product [Prunus armeniaca]
MVKLPRRLTVDRGVKLPIMVNCLARHTTYDFDLKVSTGSTKSTKQVLQVWSRSSSRIALDRTIRWSLVYLTLE